MSATPGGRGGGRAGGRPDRGGRRTGGRPGRTSESQPSRRRKPDDATERIVAGLHPVRELLRADATVHRILIAAGRDTSATLDEIRTLARRADVPVEEVERHHLDARAEGLVHQGVLAVAPPFSYTGLAEVRAATGAADDRPLLLVALDGVTDPHNLGSIARTVEAVGAHGLLVPSRRAAGVTPTVEKAAAGALAHLPVVRMANLARALRDLKSDGVWVVGLDGSAPRARGDAPGLIGDCGLLDEPLVLVVGGEGSGLARLTRDICDQLVRLPMRGRVGSLNASVAAGVALYEVDRRRGGI